MRYQSLPQMIYLVVLCLSASLINSQDMTAEEIRAFHKAAAEKRQKIQEVKLNEDERRAREQITERDERNARIASGEELSPSAIRDKKRAEEQEERKRNREESRMERNENLKSRENSRKFDIYEHEIDYDENLSKEEINKLKNVVRERERQEKIAERGRGREEEREKRERNREAREEGRKDVVAKNRKTEIALGEDGEPLARKELEVLKIEARKLASKEKDEARSKKRFDLQKERTLKRQADREARAGVPRKAGNGR